MRQHARADLGRPRSTNAAMRFVAATCVGSSRGKGRLLTRLRIQKGSGIHGRESLAAYLTVCQFLDLWRAHSGYQAVTAVFAVVQHSPVYRDIGFIVVSTTATGYKMLMG